MTPHNVSVELQGKTITIETGKLAKLADGAVTLRCGDTIILVTAVSETSLRDGVDFLPLTVDYREKAASVGKIPGGYFRREGRPTEKEILTCRMTDRPLRPLFPRGYFYETQIIGTLLSADGINDPDILAITGASAALMVSDIPFNGPMAAVRVGKIDGKYVVNPTHDEMEYSELDLVYAGTEDKVIMIEGTSWELPNNELSEAMEFAHGHVLKLVEAQKQLATMANKTKRDVPLVSVKDEILEAAYEIAGDRIEDAIYTPSKNDRFKAVNALRAEVEAKLKERFPEASDFDIIQGFYYLQKKAFRTSILDKGKRCDGRGYDEIRPLSGETGLLPRSHGSSLFARGETQALCLTTLATIEERQELDSYTGGPNSKRFILHYNFPPFSVGDTGRTGGLNRREIGHGALAERSIEPVIPAEDEFSYAIRVVSEVMESNGSTSMASVCGGSLALMDAGVPIKAPVAGISVGLVTEYNDDGSLKRYEMLTDIQGSEDHFGDMDFKLCGTRNGFTGFQLDLKLPGIPLSLMKEAVERACDARMRVLEVMEQILSTPRTELSKYAPRIELMKINPDKIGALIGPGGKNIKGIVAETGADINVDDDGTVRIYSNNPEGMDRAKEIIEGIAGEIEVGKLYRGRVVGIKDFGCFVEIFPGQDGLVHISELADIRVKRTEDVVKMGEETWVKCIGVDDKGRVKLSRKAAMKEKAAEGEAPQEEPEQSE